MLFNIIVVSSLLAVIDSASAAADPTPYMMAMSSENNPFGILKRQGYQPTETSCGPGTTCAESCGVGSEACDFGNNPSPAFNFYCYNPTEGEICCPNRMGHSCKAGYYCTEDSEKNTWCCPNGMDLASCQAIYSITGSLVSLTAPTSTASGSASASVNQITTSQHSASTSSSADLSATFTPNTTATLPSATMSPIQGFTGAANTQFLYYGLPVLAAGLVGLIGLM